MRVNLVAIRDTEYAVANMVGGKEYRFRVTAENAVGSSDPSPPSEPVSVSTDQEATEPHFLRELRDAVAVEGQKVRLDLHNVALIYVVEFSCDIIGTPRPDITWFKDGFEVYDTRRFVFLVEGDRYILVLKEAKLTDEGDIRVRATNRVGAASSQATFTVQAPPKIKLPAQYEQGLIFDTDELIRLRVPYTGRPQPHASWTHNGKQVPNVLVHDVIEGDERHTVDVSDKYVTLKIAGASRTDKGLYTLKLSNQQGKDDASFFVTVTDRPDPPSAPTITDVSGTALTLRWDPPRDDGGCRISNYIVEYFRVGWDVWLKAASSRITWMQLTDLIVGSEYRFRIKAENAYGISEAGGESQQVLIEEAKSTEGSFESETFKSLAAASSSVQKESITLLQGSGESYSFDMGGSGESSAMGSFDAGEGPMTSRARFLSHGISDEHPPSLASSEDQEQPVSVRKQPTFESEACRGPFLEAASSEERARSFETSSDERGRSFDIESSVERGQSFDIESSVDRGQSFDLESSVERGQSFEIGSSFEKGAAYDVQSSLDRGPSFDSEIIRNKPDTFQWGIADEPSQSDSLGREVSIEITGSDGLPVERGSSYEDEHLLKTAEYLAGPAGGSLDLGSSAGESMDLGGSFESMELPKAPPRSPRRGSPRSPAEQPSPAPGDAPPYHVLGAEGGCELAPTPPPRSRRSGSRASTVSELSALEVEGGCELAPTPPPRSRRPGSRSSITSESSAALGTILHFTGSLPPRLNSLTRDTEAAPYHLQSRVSSSKSRVL
ncbi:Twitchin [Portunus trituberculatus]|uniref:Twitchin n=1 Tax=Portunus trituberculatus TaxID=210409 RepID=A0A5B7D0I4_PORTR|nr:Twitchin [Portunus trituberculatus]